MKLEAYNAKRQELIDKCTEMLDGGDMGEEYGTLKASIEELDNQYEAEARELANLEALKDNKKIINLAAVGVNEPATKVLDAIGMAEEDDIYGSIEYRKAFMNYVIKGTSVPEKFHNADTSTATTDAPVVIPTTVMQKIIEKMESVGMIFAAVTKTAIRGGVKVPTSTVKPIATWVSEGSGSDKQKKTVGFISFDHYKLRCAVSMSLEMDTMALPMFETTLMQNVSEAMIKAIEQAIISGAGVAGPKGILAETPPDGQALEIAEGNGITYDLLINAEAAVPLAYENGAVWLMTKKTFAEILKIKDKNDQPICRVDHGIDAKPMRSVLGRPVLLNDYMSSFATSVSADTICMAMFNMSDYILNSNLAMTVKKYEDNETDDQVTKAIMLIDGKVVEKNSLVTVTVKNS